MLISTAGLQISVLNSTNLVTSFYNVNFSSSTIAQINTAPYVANTPIPVLFSIPYGQCQIVPSSTLERFPEIDF